MIQAHIFYSGMVQGVGFRYTTQDLASELGLKGWVKNLPNGRVEILVEGPPKDIERLMQNLEDHFGGYIRDKEANVHPAQGIFKDFQIAF